MDISAGIQKIHSLQYAAFSADYLTSFKILKIITVGLKMDSGNAIKNYHSFSGPNVCLARLQMELCRAANIFAAR